MYVFVRAEEKTAWGAALSGALVSILAGLAASSAGLVAPGAPAQAVVMEYLLPVAVPLLLLGADLRRVVRTTGDLLKAFLIGSGSPKDSSLIFFSYSISTETVDQIHGHSHSVLLQFRIDELGIKKIMSN